VTIHTIGGRPPLPATPGRCGRLLVVAGRRFVYPVAACA